MAVTIQQIAEKAGVSRGTVDRALNNRGRINPEVAKRWDMYTKQERDRKMQEERKRSGS